MFRPSIRLILVVVAGCAGDLAVSRFIMADDSYGWRLLCASALGPIGLAINGGACGWLIARGRSRAFWGGFVLGGGLMMASVYAALRDPPSETTVFSSDGTRESRTYPGGLMSQVWRGYLERAHGGLLGLGLDYEPMSTAWKPTAIGSTVFFLPQIGVACLVGWAARPIAGRREVASGQASRH